MCNTNNPLQGQFITYQMFLNLLQNCSKLSGYDTIYTRLLYAQARYVTNDFSNSLFNQTNNLFALPVFADGTYHCKTISNNGHDYPAYNSLTDSICERVHIDFNRGLSIPKSHFESAKYMYDVVEAFGYKNIMNEYLGGWMRNYNKTFTDYKITFADLQDYKDYRPYTAQDLEQLNNETGALNESLIGNLLSFIGINTSFAKWTIGLGLGYFALREINKFTGGGAGKAIADKSKEIVDKGVKKIKTVSI